MLLNVHMLPPTHPHTHTPSLFCSLVPCSYSNTRPLQLSRHQVLLRWALQSGVAVIPRSSSAQHVQENAAILDFHLSPDEMMSIDSLVHI